MYHISEQQIDFILDDIRARGVEMESLQQNLLDHICCIIENDLEANGDFESFYQRTVKSFHKGDLWEIEEETLHLLTFKNYYTMKKIMIISGTCSAAAMSVGIFFKFMHWPGASLFIVLGIALLSLLFLPLLFTLKAKEKQSNKDKLVIALGTISAILLSLGILFKVMHWPGANMMGTLMVSIMVLLFIPIYFFTGIRDPDKKVNTIVFSILAIMGCGLFLTLVNSRPSIQIHASEWSHQQMERSYQYALEKNTERYERLSQDTSAQLADKKALNKLCVELCEKIDALKLSVINNTEGAAFTKVDYSLLTRLDNYDVPTFVLFDLNDRSPKASLQHIRRDLKALNALVSEKFRQNSAGLIDLSDRHDIRFKEPVSWEVTNFYQTPLGSVLTNLTQLEIDICLVEANCL